MSATTPASDRAAIRAGFSLLEMLFVLALVALAIAVVMPRGAAMVDQATAHSVFFDFQRQVSDLRLRAYHTETPVVLAEPGTQVVGAAVVRLPKRWSYRLDRPLVISEGGACPRAEAVLLRDGRQAMRLAAADGRCRFSRLS